MSPLRQSPKYSQLSPSKQTLNHKLKGALQVTRQLKLVDKEQDAGEGLEAMKEDLSAGVGGQPYRQP